MQDHLARLLPVLRFFHLDRLALEDNGPCGASHAVQHSIAASDIARHERSLFRAVGRSATLELHVGILDRKVDFTPLAHQRLVV